MKLAPQDRLLRLTALVKEELMASGARVALIARNGTNLERFRIRYSHAGVSLASSPQGPWAVRQLYYDCDEGKPRLYDQGLAGFVLATDDSASTSVSLVLLHGQRARQLERAALDDPLALRLLAARYSANAHPYSTAYQNCNQWVMELLAAAWAPLNDDDALRAQAQRWLAAQGYTPAPIEVGSHALMAIAPFVPLLRWDDHPQDDVLALRVHTSLPSTIEHFVRRHDPTVTRIELCLDAERAVVRHGWEPIAIDARANAPCTPSAHDRVVELR
jgi:hypothetical protein